MKVGSFVPKTWQQLPSKYKENLHVFRASAAHVRVENMNVVDVKVKNHTQPAAIGLKGVQKLSSRPWASMHSRTEVLWQGWTAVRHTARRNLAYAISPPPSILWCSPFILLHLTTHAILSLVLSEQGLCILFLPLVPLYFPYLPHVGHKGRFELVRWLRAVVYC